MRLLRSIAGVLFATLVFSESSPLVAGPYADDMAKCLVTSTSTEDRTLLVRWIFSAIALHPELASMSAISPQQRDTITKNAGALFQRLLLESCKSETQQAVQNEGPYAIQYACQVLGQVATRGLFTDPQVMEGMKSLGKDVDEEKLKALLAPAKSK
jgi:hypothetical protein